MRKFAPLGSPLFVIVVACVAVACGSRSADRTASSPPSGPGAARTAVGEATTVDGRYRIALSVGEGSLSANAGPCSSAPAAGRGRLPVRLTVTNLAPDLTVPFPPVRVELVTDARRDQVLLREPSGTCTFTPRVAGIGPGESVTFDGATPEIDASSRPGVAGRCELSISENPFSLAVVVP